MPEKLAARVDAGVPRSGHSIL